MRLERLRCTPQRIHEQVAAWLDLLLCTSVPSIAMGLYVGAPPLGRLTPPLLATRVGNLVVRGVCDPLYGGARDGSIGPHWCSF
jgi:hypothetical protein